jgi:hypothetical protein
MKKLIFGLGMLLASPVWALQPAKTATSPVGTGNFRRAEVKAAAGVKAGEKVRVLSLSSASKRIGGAVNPRGTKIMFVEHGTQVDIVAAPVNKGQAVTKLTTAQANELGLITQKQGKQAAQRDRTGVTGQKAKVRVVNNGLTDHGASYAYKQVEPTSKIGREYGELVRVEDIQRSVTVTGSGESATFNAESLPKVNSSK